MLSRLILKELTALYLKADVDSLNRFYRICDTLTPMEREQLEKAIKNAK